MNTTDKQAMLTEAAKHYRNFMRALGMDPDTNVHEKDTPMRVAKSFVNDLVSGLYDEPPKITAFSNNNQYTGIVFQGNIDLQSICAHHHLPYIGKAHVAYIPSPTGKIIGLSKLNRMVVHSARRPSVQEDLTAKIADYINNSCTDNLGVAVMIEANHMCACLRGIRHNSTMITSKLMGGFLDEIKVREEFYNFISFLKK